jgi:tripartite ATP-independent transporter DctM subunit
MSTVPLFIFMGVVLFNSGVGANLYDTAYKWVGQLRGGLAMSTVLACALFAAITGVRAPAVATMGKVAVPEMRKRYYDDKLATGSIVCAGTLAFLIPPSMAFIIYGILTETSIGLLFIAGMLPGLLLVTLLMGTFLLSQRSIRKPDRPDPRPVLRRRSFP